MNNNSATKVSTAEDTTVNILADGNPITIDYYELKEFHKGDSWFGCAVGFRAMQIAARELSIETLWSRNSLSIVSGHPGAGVKDAIELITNAISSNNFQLLENIDAQICNSGCNRNMKFEWWLCSNNKNLHIKLHDNIVPELFFTLLDRINSDDEKTNDRETFDQMKTDLSNLLWSKPLDASFDFNHSTISKK